MKYMFLIYSPETVWTETEWSECVEKSAGICEELGKQGKLIDASPLHPVATALTVRVRKDESQVTTGPFAETVEQLGGYYILELKNLDEAISIASRLPPVYKGTIEIRPIRVLEDLPKSNLDAETPAGFARYLLICYDDENHWQQAGEAAHQSALHEAVALTTRLDQQGRFLSAAPLHSTKTATSVRIRDGERLITDGPFAETREVLGGYYLILARNPWDALTVAAQHPGAAFGAVEVRQIFDVTTMAE